MGSHNVDIAIIGAGSAGISALKLVRQHTDSYLLIDKGELGTTCARTGCMPSKALVEIAGHYHELTALYEKNLLTGPQPAIDGVAVMNEVRRLRDHFSDHMAQQTRALSKANFIQGSARLPGPNTILVGDTRIQAGAIIVAVGSRPTWPGSWRSLANRLLTSEQFFELASVPSELAVLGLGSIGLELGQACALLGGTVIGIEQQQTLGCLSDPAAIRHAKLALERHMPLHLGHTPQLREAGPGLELCYADQCSHTEQILAATGRRDNLDLLHMDALLQGNRLHPASLQLGELPIFVAGDGAGGSALLHEAIDEGQIAARNALAYPHTNQYQRRIPLQITFTQPQLARVGCAYCELDIHSTVVAEVALATQGRALISGATAGVIRLYASPTGKLLGAELVCSEAEHLAHLIAAWLTAGFTAAEALTQPFYHPTLEEGLRSALLQLARKSTPNFQCQPCLNTLDRAAGASPKGRA